MNNLHRLLLSGSILSLSACGGGSSSGGPDVVTPTVEQAVTLSIGTFPEGVSVIDNDDGTWTFSFPVTGDKLLSLDPVENSGIARYSDLGTTFLGSSGLFTNIILQGSTSSNSGVATYFEGVAAESTFSVVELERSGTTTIPDSGTVVMTGKTALNVFAINGSLDGSAEGNAELTVDFGGYIFGRTFDLTTFGDENTAKNQLAVTFESTPISGGGFTGTATMPSFPALISGDYQGIFVGPAAGDAIGGYSLANGIGQRVEGIFIVEQP